MMNSKLGLQLSTPLSMSGGYPMGGTQSPSSFDSKTSVPIKTIDELNKLIEIGTQIFLEFYNENLSQNEIIASIYLKYLRDNEERLNTAHDKELSLKLKVFKLEKSSLKRDQPKDYGFQKAKFICDTERELLHKELISQHGKTYFGEVALKTKNEFTKDRWFTVLLNQLLPDHKDTPPTRDFYYKQIVESKDPHIVIRTALNQAINEQGPCEIFACRAIEHLERVRSAIFQQNYLTYERGKIDAVSKGLTQLNSSDKEIILADACVQCCKNLKKLHVDFVQKIYLLKGGKQPEGRSANTTSPRQEERKQHLQVIELTCSQAVQNASKSMQTYVPLPKLSPNDLEALKKLAQESLVELDLCAKYMADFIYLFKLYRGEKYSNGCKDVFESTLKIFRMYNARK